ncbi:serine hydrolase domain-containing protein [uncultured Pontibacter sp.]|uniref:serine hydrolase domain-containing protein n=1 Tax=uncultured Pontibacter sp. TaxID=453356 RepID=UPI00262DCB63|nr:serine hydrolase domain-containing protein [uncultured Pontibacter sp.]
MPISLHNALDNLMQATYRKGRPGAALLLSLGGELLFEKGYGCANLGTSESITPATNFRLASVSKQFTAMCVQLLQQQGLLTYEDKLYGYFPALIHFGGDISINHLICHTSGLPDFEEFVEDDRQEQVKESEVLRITAAQPRLYFKPGSQYRYSNTGYVLLALLVEKVSGMPYAEFLQKYIFEPLDMANTVLYEAGKRIPNRAIGYARNAAGEVILSDQSACSATKGDGCIYTSVHDYLKWHEALLTNDAFKLDATLENISTTIGNNPGWRYGMGWFYANRSNGSHEFYHTGSTCGFSNLVIRVPESQLLVACFSNIADNPYLLTSLIDVLQQYPETRLESDLVRQLLGLTR